MVTKKPKIGLSLRRQWWRMAQIQKWNTNRVKPGFLLNTRKERLQNSRYGHIYPSFPYQEADHITFEAGWEVGGRVRWVGNFWSARIFFSCKPAGQDIFCPFSFVCRIFFPQRGSVQVFVKMYLHLHCGYCSNGPDMELQSLLLWKQATSWALTLFQATKKKRKKKQDARLS